MLPDDEKATAWNFERTIAAPVEARYVRYHVSPKRILCASELPIRKTARIVAEASASQTPSGTAPRNFPMRLP